MPSVPSADPVAAAALGVRLRQIREARGWSQETVAHRAGISRNHLQLIEQGLSDRTSRSPFNPHLSLLMALCRALEVDLASVVVDVFGPPSGLGVELDDRAEVDPDGAGRDRDASIEDGRGPTSD